MRSCTVWLIGFLQVGIIDCDTPRALNQAEPVREMAKREMEPPLPLRRNRLPRCDTNHRRHRQLDSTHWLASI